MQNVYETFTSGVPWVTSQLSGGREMNIRVSGNNDHLLHWIAAVLLVMGVALGVTAIVAWCASLVTFGQMVAVSLALVLTGTGTFFTVWQIRR
jgi:FtsH-binding integral membrane protein